MMPIKKMTLCALFAALTAVCAQISLPIGPVPITLTLLPILLCAVLMDKRYATVSTLVYVLMGLIGLPVFSGFSGGTGVLMGATGGYIVGFVPCAFIAAWMMERKGGFWWRCVSMVVGVVVCYVIGTVWFMMTKGTPLWASLTWCVFPFLPGDAAKIALAAYLGGRLKPVVSKW